MGQRVGVSHLRIDAGAVGWGGEMIGTRPRDPRLTLVAAVACLFVGTAAPSGAHEIGTTRVSVAVHGPTYEIEIATDAASLVDKLESASGQPPAPPTPSAAAVL